jgi:hypothetical protein
MIAYIAKNPQTLGLSNTFHHFPVLDGVEAFEFRWVGADPTLALEEVAT